MEATLVIDRPEVAEFNVTSSPHDEGKAVEDKEDGSLLVANPTYDVVFKYLLEDDDIARLVVSAIIGEEVIDLQPNPQERTTEKVKISGTDLTTQRLDFTARIETANGQKAILIEMQRDGVSEEIMRFRRYIGEQYKYAGDKIDTPAGKADVRQMFSVFFWGDRIERNKFPVIEVDPQPNYPATSATGEVVKVRNSRISKSFHHRSWNIQIKNLGLATPATEIERLLTVFDQQYCTADKQVLEIPIHIIPQKFRPILYRLQKAVIDTDLRRQMTAQDEFDRYIQDQRKEDRTEGEAIGLEKGLSVGKEERARLQAEKEAAQAEKEAAQAEKEAAQAEKEAAQAEKEAAQAELKQKETDIVVKSYQEGLSVEIISNFTGLTLKQIAEILGLYKQSND